MAKKSGCNFLLVSLLYAGSYCTTLKYTESLRIPEILVVPREFDKMNVSPKRPTTLKISDMKS